MKLYLGWLIVVAAVAWGVWRHHRKHKGAAATGGFARIRGNGRYSVQVVGESFYAANFEALIRRHRPDSRDDEWHGDALLVLDGANPHDANAVAVIIDGLQVGNLSRSMAVDFRAALKRDGITGRSEFAVGARLYFGGSDRMHSVTLDLPES